MNCCINGGNIIRLLFLSAKLLKFEIQKCGQILCARGPYFLMPGHNYIYIDVGCCLCTVQRAGCVFRDVVSISEVKTLCLLLINRQFL